jgi:hypothetical protein
MQDSDLEVLLIRAAKLGAEQALKEITQHPELMDKTQLADYLKCSIATVNRYMQSGMPYERAVDNGRPRFYKSEVDGWLRGSSE